MSESTRKRILAQQPNGNRSLPATDDDLGEILRWEQGKRQEIADRVTALESGRISEYSPLYGAPDAPPEPGWPDVAAAIDPPERADECASCAALAVRVAALEAEVTTALGATRDHGELLADLNDRLRLAEAG